MLRGLGTPVRLQQGGCPINKIGRAGRVRIQRVGEGGDRACSVAHLSKRDPEVVPCGIVVGVDVQRLLVALDTIVCTAQFDEGVAEIVPRLVIVRATLDRGTEGGQAILREFERWTIGAQYFFNKKSRFTINYEFRDTEAPGSAGADRIVSG